jgi:hypothetical protein
MKYESNSFVFHAATCTSFCVSWPYTAPELQAVPVLLFAGFMNDSSSVRRFASGPHKQSYKETQ